MKKLKKILLVNWLYFAKQLIEVDDVNFLTGKNGAGKSTVIDALQIVLLGETNSRNFNQAANEKSQRTLHGYLRADMDDGYAENRGGKDFSSIIACEFWDDVTGKKFVCGIIFDCRSDGSEPWHYFLYNGAIPENCFVVNRSALHITAFRKYLKEQYGSTAKLYDVQKEYQADMLAKWNVHSPQVMHMMKKAVSFRPIVDIQKFITENICDVQERPDIEQMQQNIREYQRDEQMAQRQEEKLTVLREICGHYRELQQAIDRYRQQRFLVLWSQKESLEAKIRKYENEKKDCREEIAACEEKVRQILAWIDEKDHRKNELIAICAQSNVYQEKDKLENAKKNLQKEQRELLAQLQNDTLAIKQEAVKLRRFCEPVKDWEETDTISELIAAAEELQKAYAVFEQCDYQIFSQNIAIFERAQDETEAFYKKLRDTSYQVETVLGTLKKDKDRVQAALAGLKRNQKPYPAGLHQLQSRLAQELQAATGKQVSIEILADVLEIAESEEKWRRAVEGYLNFQKFYLLVPPAYYQEALRIYDSIKADFGNHSFGLVNIGKIREWERVSPRPDSLAMKIETDNDLARTYIDYLLGKVVCCSHVNQMQKYRAAITAEGMVYQGYVARPLRRDQMDSAFIGQKAIALQIERLCRELEKTEEQIKYWSPIYRHLSGEKDRNPLFSEHFVRGTVVQRQSQFLRGLEINGKLDEIQEQLSHLDLFWLEKQQDEIRHLEADIENLRKEKAARDENRIRREERIQQLDYDILPDINQDLVRQEDSLEEEFTSEFIEKTGIPRYEQEFSRLGHADKIHTNYSNRLVQTETEERTARKNLQKSRTEYASRFSPCAFRIEAEDNDEYAEEMRVLESSKLPEYREKIKAARESAMEQFQNDFLAKLKSSIEQVQKQVKELNKALKQAQFGTDQYLFRADRNPDYADYYDMIMAPELMEGDQGLFTYAFQEKYGPLIESLFSQLAASDDTQFNARKQSELQQNIQRYTDFRTYLKFDLETTDQNGCKQLLSQTLNKKSGGETQTPFYIAVLASFAQLYQVNNLSPTMNNTVRLVVFDEAFNKMDSERIVESIKLLRKMGLQAIICTPPDKLPDIMPLADRTFLVRKDKYKMHILSYGKEGITV